MNESATVECPWCQQSLTIPPEAFGQRVSCQFCSGKFVANLPPTSRAAPQFHSAEQQDEAGETGPQPDRSEAGLLWALGLGGLLVSGLAGYWGLYEPLEKMRQHASKISYSGKVIFFLPFFAVFTLTMIVGAIVVSLRRKSRRLVRAPRQSWDHDFSTGGNIMGWLGVAVVLAAGFWLIIWFEDQVEKHGYRNGFLNVTLPRQRDSLLDPGPDGSREIDRIMRRKNHQDFFQRLKEAGIEPQEFWKDLEKQLMQKPVKKP